MKIKCKKCNDIIENTKVNTEIWCSCKSIGLFNDYITCGKDNILKEKSYIDLTPKKSLQKIIKELNELENN